MAATQAKTATKSEEKTPGLSVKTIKGVKTFRRAGMTFSEKATLLSTEELGEDKVKALMNEPRLRVTEVEDINATAEKAE